MNVRQRQIKWLQSNDLWQPILDITSWMPESTVSNIRVSWIVNSAPRISSCRVCGKPASWQTRPPHFSEWCSVACKNKDPEVRKGIGKKNHDNATERTKKMVATKIDRYGINGSLLGTDITNGKKHLATMIERYGKDWAKDWYDECTKNNGGIHPANAFPHRNSKQEIEIANAIIEMGISCDHIEHNNRSILDGKELDLWIPEKRIAIEHCGEVWHSSMMRPRPDDRYHIYDKMKCCESLGITLYTIFGIEWQTRRPQILNLLRSKFALPSNKLFARRCSVLRVEGCAAKKFIEANHIQGCKKAPSLSYGLFFDDGLIAVMGFDHHPRISTTMTLSRFCCLPGYQIVGGASKLFKHAADEQNWNHIISWSDNRWSSGKLYEAIGFIKAEELKPDYKYFSSQGIFSKQSCTKKDLLLKHPELNPNDTEEDMAKQVGLFRFYDCGKIRWEWHRSK